jgi:hypothetical protein
MADKITKPNTPPANAKAPAPGQTPAKETAPAELTETQKKRKEKAASRKADFTVIATAVKDGSAFFEGMAEGLKAALQSFFTVVTRSSSGGVMSNKVLTDKVYAMFAAKNVGDTIDELDLFKAVKIGRGEMRRRSREFVNMAAESRLWVKFNEANETWELAGKGATPPSGWTGFIPTEKAA